MAGAVGPGGLEPEANAAVAREPEAVLGDGRPEEVAAELLEPGSVRGRHPHIGVEVESIEMRLPGAGGRHPDSLRVVAQAPDTGPGAPAEGYPALDGGGADPGEGEGFLREGIRRDHVLLARQPPAPEQPPDTSADDGEQPGDLGVARGQGRVKTQAARRLLAEHPVEGEGVEVDVQVEPAPEALDDGEGARVAIVHSVLPPLMTVEVQEGPDEDAEDGAAEAVVPGEQVAQAVGEAQHPLADGDAGQHTIHEVGGALGHAAAPATGAEATALAGEGDQPLQGAGVAPEPREAVGEDAAGQELAELPLHEPGEAGAVGALSRFLEKGVQVGADDGVEDAAYATPVGADVRQAAAGRVATSGNGANRGQARRSLREPSSAMPMRVRANQVRGIQRFSR